MPTNKCRRNYRRKKSPFHNLIVIIDGGKKSVDAKTSGQKFDKEQNIDIIPKFLPISCLFTKEKIVTLMWKTGQIQFKSSAELS